MRHFHALTAPIPATGSRRASNVATRLLAVAFFALLACAGCPAATPGPGPAQPDPDPIAIAPSMAGRVLWKRHAALRTDLARALALPKDALCKELDTFDCVKDVFLTPLGGNEPFVRTQYEREALPTAVTPVALERVVWAGCQNRAAHEKAGAATVVFAGLAGQDTLVSPRDKDALAAVASGLIGRGFARDALPSERAAAASIVDTAPSLSRHEAAVAVCAAVLSSAETLFY